VPFFGYVATPVVQAENLVRSSMFIPKLLVPPQSERTPCSNELN
jgi:hypothetical protein